MTNQINRDLGGTKVMLGVREYVVDDIGCVWTIRRGKIKLVKPHTPSWYAARQLAKNAKIKLV